ncbi:uncharacterized protein [Dysidea avara]|uniref:uncharacterized protein isoform X2 n=1 Tax=Dysidea avara TaxID=196820 RepID=UPI00332CA827
MYVCYDHHSFRDIKAWNLEVYPSYRCILLGNSATINCLNATANGFSTFPNNIQWFKLLNDRGLLPINISQGGRIRSDGHQLRFYSTIASDNGLYCCKSLSTSLGDGCLASATSNLTIALPPVISYISNYNVSVGDSAHLECFVNDTGETAAFMFSWQMFGVDLPEGLKYHITQTRNSISLTITNVTVEDEGYYSCVVKNSKHQQDNESIYLSVDSKSPGNIDSNDGCDSSEHYNIAVRIQQLPPTGNCTLQIKVVREIFLEIFVSLCNCLDGYCIEVNSIECLDDSLAAVVINLRGEMAMNLQTQIYSKTEYQVVLEGITYLLSCINNEFCGEERTTVGDVNVSTEKYSNTETIAIITVATILGFLMTVLVLMLVTFFFCHCKHRQLTNLSSTTVNPQLSLVTVKHPSNYNIQSQTFVSASETPESSSSLPVSNQFPNAASSVSHTNHFHSGSPDDNNFLPTSSTEQCQHSFICGSPLTVDDTEQITPTSECSSSYLSSLVAPTSSPVYCDHSDQTIVTSEPKWNNTLPYVENQFLISNNANPEVFSNQERGARLEYTAILPGSKTESKPSLPSEVQTSQSNGTLLHDKSSLSRTTRTGQPLVRTHNSQYDNSGTLPPNKNGYYPTSIAMRSRNLYNDGIKWRDNVSYVSSLGHSTTSNSSKLNEVHHYETIDEIYDKRNKNSSQQFQHVQNFVTCQPDRYKADKSCPVPGRCDFQSPEVPQSSRESIENETLISHKMLYPMPFVDTSNSVVDSSCKTDV